MKTFASAVTTLGFGLLKFLKELPSWIVLLVLFFFLTSLYHVRPDAVTEDLMKGVVGALLVTLQGVRTQQPPHP